MPRSHQQRHVSAAGTADKINPLRVHASLFPGVFDAVENILDREIGSARLGFSLGPRKFGPTKTQPLRLLSSSAGATVV